MAHPPILKAALHGNCPRCSSRTAFSGPAEVAQRCRACGLNLAAIEPSGRINGLLTMAIAVILIILALAIDEAFRPPLWLHAIIWAPLTIAAVLGALRLTRIIGLYRAYDAAADRTKDN